MRIPLYVNKPEKLNSEYIFGKNCYDKNPSDKIVF